MSAAASWGLSDLSRTLDDELDDVRTSEDRDAAYGWFTGQVLGLPLPQYGGRSIPQSSGRVGGHHNEHAASLDRLGFQLRQPLSPDRGVDNSGDWFDRLAQRDRGRAP